MEITVSVIIPTHKRPDRLERALKSVLDQSFSDFEVLIIDDDPDGEETVKVVNNFNDTRLKLFKNERSKGANGARNTGILHAKGNYIAFLDDDDEWLPINLKSQIEKIKNTDDKIGMVYGGYLMEKKVGWEENFQNQEGNLFSALILDRLFIGASSNIFIKREVIDQVGLWDEDLLRQQDLEFLVRVLESFNAVFNNQIIAKVYGHNDPPAAKSFKAREAFLKKISSKLDNLNKNDQEKFLSNHFRRQAMYSVQMKCYKQALNLWHKAIKNKNISLKKDARIILAFFQKQN